MTTPGGSAWGPHSNNPQQPFDQVPQQADWNSAPAQPDWNSAPQPDWNAGPPAPSTSKRLPIALMAIALVAGLAVGGGVAWGIFGLGGDDTSTTVATPPPAAPEPPMEKAEPAYIPARLDVPSPHEGKTGHLGGPSFAPEDPIDTVALDDMPFKYSVPAVKPQWTCWKSTQSELAPAGSCSEPSTVPVSERVATTVMVRQCANSCGDKDRKVVRNAGNIIANLWRKTDDTTYYASLSKIMDGAHITRIVMAHFVAAKAGGPIDTGIVTITQGPAEKWVTMQKIVNDIRFHAAAGADPNAAAPSAPAAPKANGVDDVIAALPEPLRAASKCDKGSTFSGNANYIPVSCTIAQDSEITKDLFKFTSRGQKFNARIDKLYATMPDFWRKQYKDQLTEVGKYTVKTDAKQPEYVSLDIINAEAQLQLTVMGFKSVDAAKTFLTRAGIQ